MACLLACAAWAGIHELPIKKIDNVYCYIYKVKPQQTVYGISAELGIDSGKLLQYNPKVNDQGLKANSELVFPCAAFVPETFVVRKKDTAYSLSRTFGLSLERFYELNPGACDGLTAGQTVRLGGVASAPAVSQAESVVKPAPSAPAQSTPGRYTIAQGETLYSIARSHGISLTQLLVANPDLDVVNYAAGTVINIPAGATTPAAATESKGTPSPAELFGGQNQATDDESKVPAVSGNADAITIAVALPFMAENADRPRQAVLFTEFYRGLLLAVDSMRNCGTPIKILAYDTNGTDSGVSSVLADPSLRQAKVIIGPDNQQHFSSFADFGRDNGINVLNLFVVKDQSYLTNPAVMHSNIPHTDMYARAVDYLTATFPDVTPVVLMRKGGLDDKGEFVGMLKSRSLHGGRDVKTIEFEDELTIEHLRGLDPSGRYAFVPISSKLSELNKITEALVTYEKTLPLSGNNMLWGYPEWLSFRGEPQAAMNQLNTYIFSRFFTSPTEDFDSQRIKNNYTAWYGKNMASVIPNQGLYGFDAGMYIISALLQNDGNFDAYTPLYDGVQNCFNFTRAGEGKGWINNEMFFIHYAPSGMVSKITL